MPKYLFQASYSSEGAKGLVKEGGTLRRAVIEKAAQSVGGKLESFYFAFGGIDAFVIVDLPDNTTAAALALTVSASGTGTIKTTVLITPAEMDGVMKVTPSYRAPGKEAQSFTATS